MKGKNRVKEGWVGWGKESYHLFWILLFLWILVKFILKHSGASAWSKWVYLECFVSFHFSIFRQRCLLYIDCSFIINSAVYYYFLASRIIEIRKYSMVEFCENAGMLMVYSISLFFRDSLWRQVWFLDTAFWDTSLVCFDNVHKCFGTSHACLKFSRENIQFRLIKQNLANAFKFLLKHSG